MNPLSLFTCAPVSRNGQHAIGALRIVNNRRHMHPLIRCDVRIQRQALGLTVFRAIGELEIAGDQLQDKVPVAALGMQLLHDDAAGRSRLDPGLDRHRTGQYRAAGDLEVVGVVRQVQNAVLERAQAVQRIRALGQLDAVLVRVVVGVILIRVRARGLLLNVGQVVVVRVTAEMIRAGHVRVGARQVFVEVEETVTVEVGRFVRRGRVAEIRGLPGIREAVAIHIRPAVENR